MRIVSNMPNSEFARIVAFSITVLISGSACNAIKASTEAIAEDPVIAVIACSAFPDVGVNAFAADVFFVLADRADCVGRVELIFMSLLCSENDLKLIRPVLR